MSKIFPSIPVPNAAGIGLRSQHVAEMLGRRPSAGWLEVHAENYMGDSPAVEALEVLRETYPLSIHGVGLSLGSASGLDSNHLERLCKVHSTMTEAEFLSELVRLTDCGLLLDVNNVYVSAENLGFDARAFIDQLPANAVGEIHLAGHAVNEVDGDVVLIDDHGSRVPPAVWSLYAYALRRIGPRPTLIEWDTKIPALDVLLGEAMWADMLAQSIVFERRATEMPAREPTSRFEGLVIPFGKNRDRGPMPALAALATITPSVFADRAGKGRTGHAF